MATRFEAKTRLPFRPLSYENVDMAVEKELIADYKTGNLYIKTETGDIIDLTESISKAVAGSGEIGKYLNVTYVGFDGQETTVTINAAVIDIVEKIKEQQKVIDVITGNEGGETVVIQIKPGQIITDSTHRFVTDTQLNEIAQKVATKEVICLLPHTGWIGSKAPYYQTVACTGALTTMPRPVVDINHTTEETFENAMKAEDNWCYIYKATTGDNTITVYASEKPEVDLSMVVQMFLPGLSAGPIETFKMSTNSVDGDASVEES